jgi:RNA polymerase sigma-70 factor, ECF subfamily
MHDPYLRWPQSDTRDVRSKEAWLVTSITRLCIDRPHSLKTEREAYFGPWRPEPLLASDVESPG